MDDAPIYCFAADGSDISGYYISVRTYQLLQYAKTYYLVILGAMLVHTTQALFET